MKTTSIMGFLVTQRDLTMSSLIWSAQNILWKSLTKEEQKPWIDKAVQELHDNIKKEQAILGVIDAGNYKE